MLKENVLKEVNGIFREVLDLPDLVISPETSAKDVEEWDSLNHIQLIVAIEKHFKVKFTAKEIQGWKDVGAMVECISAKRTIC